MEKIGKYDLLEKIGMGGFGEVYKGRDPLIKRLVAIKTCNSTDPLIRERFFKEAEIAGNLHHRNITTVYDFGLQDDLPYIVQEYLSGEDLDHKIKRGDFLPYPEKLFYLLQIARGLAYAHSQGVVHRDVKPGNVRILEDGTTKILDFGIAKLAQQETGLTQTGMTLGTAAYLAPEQIRGETANHCTDVFSFGILAYELLAYERPFPGQQISVVIHQILDLEPQPLIEKWPDAPPQIVAVIERCLDKDPARRYAHGGELLRALEAVQKTGRGEQREPDDAPTLRISKPQLANKRERSVPATASGARAQQTPPAAVSRTLDSAGFGASSRETQLTAPRGRRRSRVFGLLAVALLAIGAAAGGWWLGQRGDDPSADAGETADRDSITDAQPTAEDHGNQDLLGTADDVPPSTLEETDEPATESSELTETVAAETEAPKLAIEPPPPSLGTLVLEPADWTRGMTAEVGGKTYTLVRQWRVELPPGSRSVTFQLDDRGYTRRETLSVELAAGKTVRLTPPIRPPGALSIRPFPNKPRGEVWLDGELLGQTPIAGSKTVPGPHRIEIRSLEGEERRLEWDGTVESGQDTVLSFDLDSRRISARNKELSP